MKREYLAIQGALAAAGAYLSGKLGILFPVLCMLAAIMVVKLFGAVTFPFISWPLDKNAAISGVIFPAA